MNLLDRNFNLALPITADMRPIRRELNEKYCPLYDLKMNSLIEDIETQYSLAEVAKKQKIEHAIKLEQLEAQ